jgi:CelD/BcsL family acetyltransferase involved in cellulose biosynthesis
MRLDGRAVATQLAVECAGKFWLLKIGYDEDYSDCSPGMLLMLETLKYASDAGLESYEFLGTAEAWTRRWTEQEHECVEITALPYDWNGIALMAKRAIAKHLLRIRNGWKNVARD